MLVLLGRGHVRRLFCACFGLGLVLFVVFFSGIHVTVVSASSDTDTVDVCRHMSPDEPGNSMDSTASSFGFQKGGIALHRRRAVDAWLRHITQNEKLSPGAVVMAEKHGDVYVGQAGDARIRPDALFRICSLTKAIVSVAALSYVQDGLLALDDDVVKYIPELNDIPGVVVTQPNPGHPWGRLRNMDNQGVHFPRTFTASDFVKQCKPGEPTSLDNFNCTDTYTVEPLKRSITVRHLLTHTAGFTYEFFGKKPDGLDNSYHDLRTHIVSAGFYPAHKVLNGCQCTENERDVSAEENVVKRLAKSPLVSQPGERMSYGLSTDVLGVLLQRVERSVRQDGNDDGDDDAALPSLEDVLKQRVFEPLGMNETFFHRDERRAQTNELAPLFHLPSPGAHPVECHDGATKSTPLYCRLHARAVDVRAGDNPPSMQSGGCGLLSTPRDYLKFVRFLADATAPEVRRRGSTGTGQLPVSLTAMRRALLVDRLDDDGDWAFKNVGAGNRAFGWNFIGHVTRDHRWHSTAEKEFLDLYDDLLVAPLSQTGKGLHGLLYYVDAGTGVASLFFHQCHGFDSACFAANNRIGAVFGNLMASL